MRAQFIISIIGVSVLLSVNLVPAVEATARTDADTSALQSEVPTQAADASDSLPTCDWGYNTNASCISDDIPCSVNVVCGSGEAAVGGGCMLSGANLSDAYLIREKVFQANSPVSNPTDGEAWYELYENSGFECTYRNAAGATLYVNALCCGN